MPLSLHFIVLHVLLFHRRCRTNVATDGHILEIRCMEEAYLAAPHLSHDVVGSEPPELVVDSPVAR